MGSTTVLKILQQKYEITTGQTEDKLSLYPDEVILFTSHLEKKIPDLLQLIKSFDAMLGHAINNTKYSVLLLNE